MQVDRVRRVRAGDDERARFHRVDHHLAAAADRIGERRRCRRRAAPSASAAAAELAAAGDLFLDPLGIQLEARVVFQRRLGVEQTACADA